MYRYMQYRERDAVLKIFNEAGYQEVDFKQVADVYVINTCTVTNTGDSKSRQMIRKAIRKNPKATICVVGCYSQTAPEEIENRRCWCCSWNSIP